MLKKTTTLILSILFSSICFAQNEVYIVVEKMPEFPGGEDAFISYMKNTPKPEGIEELDEWIFVKFVVDTAGNVIDPWVDSKLLSTAQKTPIINYVEKMPQWTPGSQRGKKVFVQMTWPLNKRKSEPNLPKKKYKKRK